MPARRRLRQLALPLLALTAVVSAAACGSADPGTAPAPAASSPAAVSALPATLQHAFGSTTVGSAPQRVVTWGWGSADAAIALGVVPVAIPRQAYGGDAEGVLPWVRERLQEEGKPVPWVLPDVESAPVEAIAAARPDLVLAPYSGIAQKEYDLLSKVAPTVAYPREAWATPWRETVQMVGTALGRPQAATDLLAGIDARLAATATAHPELTGKSVAMVFPTADAVYVYKPADARVAFAQDLGMVSAPSVAALADGASTFTYTLSAERLPDLTSDVLVLFAATQAEADRFLASPGARLMPQVQRGAVATVVGEQLIASVSPPTALSVTWGLDRYVDLLSRAAQTPAA